MARADAVEYMYLTLPPERPLGSCIGLVVAGLAARARIGAAVLEEAVDLLEGQQAANEPTRYRFSLKDEGLLAEIEERQPAPVRGAQAGRASSWRTVVELVS